jgi:hypothetical protein
MNYSTPWLFTSPWSFECGQKGIFRARWSIPQIVSVATFGQIVAKTPSSANSVPGLEGSNYLRLCVSDGPTTTCTRKRRDIY